MRVQLSAGVRVGPASACRLQHEGWAKRIGRHQGTRHSQEKTRAAAAPMKPKKGAVSWLDSAACSRARPVKESISMSLLAPVLLLPEGGVI